MLPFAARKTEPLRWWRCRGRERAHGLQALKPSPGPSGYSWMMWRRRVVSASLWPNASAAPGPPCTHWTRHGNPGVCAPRPTHSRPNQAHHRAHHQAQRHRVGRLRRHCPPEPQAPSPHLPMDPRTAPVTRPSATESDACASSSRRRLATPTRSATWCEMRGCTSRTELRSGEAPPPPPSFPPPPPAIGRQHHDHDHLPHCTWLGSGFASAWGACPKPLRLHVHLRRRPRAPSSTVRR